MLLQVLPHNGIEEVSLVIGKVSPRNEDLPQRSLLLQDPCMHRGDQRVASDEVDLQREYPEEQVAVSSECGHQENLPRQLLDSPISRSGPVSLDIVVCAPLFRAHNAFLPR